MIFEVQFKTPEAVEYGIASATESLAGEERKQAIKACEGVAELFVKYGEYVTVVFDTDDGTAVVKQAK